MFFIFVFELDAQVEDLSVQKNIFYQDEYSIGFKLNNNGWGMDFRKGFGINPHKKKMYEIGFNIIKHPKEYKFSSVHSFSSFVYGKMNSVMDLKVGYGHQFVLYDKKEVGTTEIRLFYFVGADIAVLKPIYYIVIVDMSTNPYTKTTEKYKPSHQPLLIDKKASFAKGLDEIKINPGLYFKVGTSFEHSKQVKYIRSLELGIEVYAFLKRLEIMAQIDNPRVIVSVFASYRMGSIIYNKKNKDKKDLNF